MPQSSSSPLSSTELDLRRYQRLKEKGLIISPPAMKMSATTKGKATAKTAKTPPPTLMSTSSRRPPSPPGIADSREARESEDERHYSNSNDSNGNGNNRLGGGGGGGGGGRQVADDSEDAASSSTMGTNMIKRQFYHRHLDNNNSDSDAAGRHRRASGGQQQQQHHHRKRESRDPPPTSSSTSEDYYSSNDNEDEDEDDDNDNNNNNNNEEEDNTRVDGTVTTTGSSYSMTTTTDQSSYRVARAYKNKNNNETWTNPLRWIEHVADKELQHELRQHQRQQQQQQLQLLQQQQQKQQPQQQTPDGRKIRVRPQQLWDDNDNEDEDVTATDTVTEETTSSYDTLSNKKNQKKIDISKGSTPLKPPSSHRTQQRQQEHAAKTKATKLFVETPSSPTSPTSLATTRRRNTYTPAEEQRDEHYDDDDDDDDDDDTERQDGRTYSSNRLTPKIYGSSSSSGGGGGGGSRSQSGHRKNQSQRSYNTKSVSRAASGNGTGFGIEHHQPRPYSCTAVDSSKRAPRNFGTPTTVTTQPRRSFHPAYPLQQEQEQLDVTYVSQPGFLPPKNSFHDVEDEQDSYVRHEQERNLYKKDNSMASLMSRLDSLRLASPMSNYERQRVDKPHNDIKHDEYSTYSDSMMRLPPAPSLIIPSLPSKQSLSSSSTGLKKSLISPAKPTKIRSKEKNIQKKNDALVAAKFRSATTLSRSFDTCRSSRASLSKKSPEVSRQNDSFESEPNRVESLPNIQSGASLDQRTVRLLYASEFTEMVHVHSTQHVKQILTEHSKKMNSRSIPSSLASSGLSFVVRKRPLLETEKNNGDFDVVETPDDFSPAVVLYEAGILEDRKTRDLKAHLFRVDNVFGSGVSSDDFYVRVGQPLVESVVYGEDSALLSIGFKGSGKSYTISAIEERAVYDIFANVGDSVFLEYLEIRGDQCIDLLGPVGNFVSIETSKGKCFFSGAAKKFVSSPDEMLMKISDAKRRSQFSSQSRFRQGIETPSCLVCRVTIAESNNAGTLSLIEAGMDSVPAGSPSEKKSPVLDVMNNIRYMISTPTTKLPSSKENSLIKILKPVLDSESSRLCIVGNISPASVDTESTLSTLLTLKTTMKGFDGGGTSTSGGGRQVIVDDALVLPRQWTNDQLIDFLRRKRLLQKQVPDDIDGRMVMRMSKRQLEEVFFLDGGDDERSSEKANRLFLGLRAENDKIARLRVKKKLAEQKQKYKTITVTG